MSKNAVTFEAVVPFYPFSNTVVSSHANRIDIHTNAFAKIQEDVATNRRAIKALIKDMVAEHRKLPKDKRGEFRRGGLSINPFTAREAVLGFVSKVKHGESFTNRDVEHYLQHDINFVTYDKGGHSNITSRELTQLIADDIIKRVSRGVYTITGNVVAEKVKVAHKSTEKNAGKNKLTPVDMIRVYESIDGSKGYACYSDKLRSHLVKFKNSLGFTQTMILRSANHGEKATLSQSVMCSTMFKRLVDIGLLEKIARGIYVFAVKA